MDTSDSREMTVEEMQAEVAHLERKFQGGEPKIPETEIMKTLKELNLTDD